MAENMDIVRHQLVTLLGAPNVSHTGENFLVKPASTPEVVEVIHIALKENYFIEANKYTIGPTYPSTPGRKIILSLERMSKVVLDRNRHTLTVEPAVTADIIMKLVSDNGYAFTGTTCHHQRETIGENVVACFNQGEPDFKCSDACLCGLEMVLGDGRVITLGDMSIKDFDNYQLSYIMGGYSEEKAILTGVYLKLLS